MLVSIFIGIILYIIYHLLFQLSSYSGSDDETEDRQRTFQDILKSIDEARTLTSNPTPPPPLTEDVYKKIVVSFFYKPTRYSDLSELEKDAIILVNHWDLTQNIDYLNLAIIVHGAIASLKTRCQYDINFHTYTDLCLERYRHTRLSSDLHFAIDALDTTIHMCEVSGQVYEATQVRLDLARPLLTQYYLTGNTTDLSRSIGLLKDLANWYKGYIYRSSRPQPRSDEVSTFKCLMKTHSALLGTYFRVTGERDYIIKAVNVLADIDADWRYGEFDNPAALRFGITGSMEDLVEAVELQLELKLKSQGDEHLAKRRYIDLASMYIDLGQYTDAVKLLETCQEWIEGKTKRPLEFERIKILSDLAVCYRMMGLEERVRDIGNRFLETVKTITNLSDHIYANEHFETLTNILRLLSSAMLFEDSIKFNDSILQHCMAHLKIEETLGARAELAFAYAKVGKGDPVNIMEECIREGHNVNGPEHIQTIRHMHQLALIYDILQRPKDALEAQIVCYNLKRRRLGLDHPETKESLDHIARLGDGSTPQHI
jgi:tetratricopeptide (TPR) repeat protein